MGERINGAEADDALARDYEYVAGLGAKRTTDLSRQGDAGGRAAFERLVARGFAVEQHGAMILRRPEDCPIPLEEPRYARMRVCYLEWLRADSTARPARPRGGCRPRSEDDAHDDELLYGELGFWQHWWNRVCERDYEARGPLPMDIVIADDGAFEARSWLSEFDPEVRAHVLDGGLLRGRVIVPPQVLRSAAEPMLDLSVESGIEVRVLSTEARFVLYDGSVAVLNEPPVGCEGRTGDQPEPYWAVRNSAVVDPLRHFFALLWRSAIPFRAYRGEREAVLGLLSRGYTDARIAQVLNLSARTVSRRVSEIMAEHGAGSRFELGMMHGRSQHNS